ncbi:hypothetical protein QUA69_28130 [Microcoleus sp. LAD1_D1]|uniref:P-loop ATPase, Sll1717 family n=1 Tax=Microcoleus sp. LAD1_D1 TaxID=2818812 RepID=UPI002FD63891
MKNLADLISFGDVAAEDDAVLDYFLSTNAVEDIKSGKVFLVLGRKGTGKTAMVRYFSESSENKTSRSLSLRGYPWAIHASRIDYGASDIEAYVSSWRYLIAVEMASLVLQQPKVSMTYKSEILNAFLQENYGGPSPDLNKILQPKKLSISKFSLLPAFAGFQLGGVDLERKKGDHNFGLELNALSSAIMSVVHEVARDLQMPRLMLHFDELDQGLDRLSDERRHMLIGLILAAREVRREAHNAEVKINPVVYLRSDLWDEMTFSDKNKISQTLTLNLNWGSEDLLKLINARLKAKLGDGSAWDTISEPDLMRGSQTKWNHVLNRTFNRPRDVIQFLNTALSAVKNRSSGEKLITNKDIVKSRDAYSLYLKEELDDEIKPHWPEWTEALQAFSNISTLTFDKSTFVVEYGRRKSKDNAVDADQALELMYRFSVIAYETRSGYGGSAWSFRYVDKTAGWDNSATKFKVHLGLKEYAKLREERKIGG